MVTGIRWIKPLKIENGNKVDDVNESLFNKQGNNISSITKDKDKDKEYNSTKNYKPSGIYTNDILERIQNKFGS